MSLLPPPSCRRIMPFALVALACAPSACGSQNEDPSGEWTATHREALVTCQPAWVKWDFTPWPNGVVKYERVGTWTPAQITNLNNAMNEWVSATNGMLSFVLDPSAPDRVRISNTGCAQATGPGYHPTGTDLGVDSAGGTTVCAKHDLGHVLGAGHEHIRSDRDRYVTVDTTQFTDPNVCYSAVWLADGAGTTDYGIYNSRSIMSYDSSGDLLHNRDDGSTWFWDTDVTSVAPQDGSNLIELYAQKLYKWERFRPLGIYTSGTAKLNNQLAPGVTIASSPALAAQKDGSLDLYVLGSNNKFYRRSCTGGCGVVAARTNRLLRWFPESGFTELNSNGITDFIGPPSAASRVDGQVTLIARRTQDGAIYEKVFNNGQGSVWNSLGKPINVTFASGPAIVAAGDGTLDLFVRATNGNIYGRNLSTGIWFSWYVPFSVPAGVTFTGDLAAVAISPSHLEVYSMSSTGVVYYRKRISGTWDASWSTVGSGLNSTSAPAIASTGSGAVTLLARSSANRLVQYTRTSATGSYGAKVPLGGEFGLGSPAAHGYKGHVDVVIVGTTYSHAETDAGLRYRYYPRRFGRTRGDFDGDGKGDFVYYRPATQAWNVKPRSGGPSYFVSASGAGAGPLEDFDNDGRTDGVFLAAPPTNWIVKRSLLGDLTAAWGGGGDVFLHGDYDGDGQADFALFRPSDGRWWIAPSNGAPGYSVVYGAGTDKMVPGDYDGDWKTDVALYRPSQGKWYILRSGSSENIISFGGSTDIPVPADYDGDGLTDVAYFHPADGTWHIRPSAGGSDIVTAFGQSGDQLVPKDYDGDGKVDLAYFRNGTWRIRPSLGGADIFVDFGTATDFAF